MKVVDKHKAQVIVLYVATLLGVLIGVVVSVVNTRALSPEHYGNFRYVQNIISLISSLLLLGFFTSGSRLLAISDNESHSRTIRGTMLIILGITILIMMFCMAVISYVYIDFNIELSKLFYVAIPVCSNVLMLNYINTTAQGDNHVYRIAFARTLPSLFYLAVAVCVYKKYCVSEQLMLLLYNGIAILFLVSIIISTKPNFKNIKDTFLVLLKENKSYGFNVYLGSLMGVSTQYIAGITLGLLCSDNSNVGFYTLALSISTPLSLLPTIVGTTYFKKFSKESRISMNVLKSTILLTSISCILYCIFIKYIVSFLYDSSYSSVSKYAQVLAIGMSFHGLGDMFNRFLGAHGKGIYLRNAAFGCGIVAIIGSTLGIYFYQINGAIITKVLSSMTYMFILIFYYNKYINKLSS